MLPASVYDAVEEYAKRIDVPKTMAVRLLLVDALGVSKPPCRDHCANTQQASDGHDVCMCCGRRYPPLSAANL